MADMNDLEGGGGSTGYGVGSAPSSGGYGNVANPLMMDADHAGSSSGLAYDSGKAKRRTYNGHRYQSLLMGAAGTMNNSMLQRTIGVLVAVLVVGAFMLPLQMKILWLVYGAVVFGAVVSMWLSKNVLSCDDGTAEMRAVVSLFISYVCICIFPFSGADWYLVPYLLSFLL